VHPRRVEPHEERLLVARGLVDEFVRGGFDLLEDTGPLTTKRMETIDDLAVRVRVDDAARSVLLPELGSFG
jgi:hypothetical protein